MSDHNPPPYSIPQLFQLLFASLSFIFIKRCPEGIHNSVFLVQNREILLDARLFTDRHPSKAALALLTQELPHCRAHAHIQYCMHCGVNGVNNEGNGCKTGMTQTLCLSNCKVSTTSMPRCHHNCMNWCSLLHCHFKATVVW